MDTLIMFGRYEIGFLLAALMAVVVFQLLTGRIKTQGLLNGKTNPGGVSPARVQLLLFTLGFAFYVLSYIVKSHQFPDIETKWLLILAGSHSMFLGGKGLPLLLSRLKSNAGGD